MWFRLRIAIWKELVSYLQDPTTRRFLIGAPIFQTIVFAYAGTLDVQNVDLAVLDRDNGRWSHELVARVKALLRRVHAMASASARAVPQTIDVTGLVIQAETRTVLAGGKAVELTAREFDLLLHFARHPGRVYSRSQLLDQVWGYGHEGYEHTVNSHVNRLRAKIEKDPAKPDYVLTVWGVGYKFTDARAARSS